MSLQQVSTGRDAPNDINVVIEIPLNGEAVKYEVDKETGAIFVDRVLNTAMRYPVNYGYVPKTLCGDGDPVDVLVVMPIPLIPGSVVRCRPIGALKMIDDAGEDVKVLAVPVNKVTELYAQIDSMRQLPPNLLDQIQHFFQHYKDLEKGKWVKIDGWVGPEEAKKEITDAIERFKNAPDKPNY
jgi:inorganic pyrophosphatase